MAYDYDGVMVDNHNQQKLWDWWKRNKNIGGGTSNLFGGNDYYELLKEQVANYTWLGSAKNAREAAHQFFTHNPQFVNETNREGYTGTDKQNIGDSGFNLMELLRGTGDTRFIGAHVGKDPDARIDFTYYDFIHARTLGYSDREILEWLDTDGKSYKDKMVNDHGQGAGNIYHHIWTEGNPEGYPYGGEETDKPVGDVEETGPIEGIGGDLYGATDYAKALLDDWNKNKSSANLIQIRADALKYLEDGTDVHANNRPVSAGGKEDGLHNKILTTQRRTDHPDRLTRLRGKHGRWYMEDQKLHGDFTGLTEAAIQAGDPGAPEDKNNFTIGDYLAAKAGGHDDYDIYKYLKANEDLRESEEAETIYNTVRGDLIQRGYKGGDSYSDYHYFLENPLWQELGEYLQTRDVGDFKHRALDNFSDFKALKSYINENYTHEMAAGGTGMVTGFRTDDDLKILTGIDPGKGEYIGSEWEDGEYWQRYGAEGPPDRDQGDGHNKSDLKWVEKMIAHTGLIVKDASVAKDTLEDWENKFLGELYGEDALYLEAEDHWGLDIVREVGDVGSGKRLDWAAADSTNEEWWNTLTRGRVNWAFYQTDKEYLMAAEQLGFDENLTKDKRKIDTIQEIRQANIYIHGRYQADTEVDLTSWVPYEDQRTIKRKDGKFYEKATDGSGGWVEKTTPDPKELEITGYDAKKYWQEDLGKEHTAETYVNKNPTEIKKPTITVRDVEIKRPDKIPDDWTIKS